jgi:hypothetical protein
VLKSLGLVWNGNDEVPMDRGTRIHVATAYDDEGSLDEASVKVDDLPYLKAWRRFRRETGFVVESIEERVWDESLGVGGTIDRRGTFPNHPRFKKFKAIVDIKAGQIQPFVRLQTAGYGHGWLAQHAGTKLKFGWFVRCAVGLRPNGNYFIKWYGLEDWHKDLTDWRAVVRAAHWKREHIR